MQSAADEGIDSAGTRSGGMPTGNGRDNKALRIAGLFVNSLSRTRREQTLLSGESIGQVRFTEVT